MTLEVPSSATSTPWRNVPNLAQITTRKMEQVNLVHADMWFGGLIKTLTCGGGVGGVMVQRQKSVCGKGFSQMNL